MGPEFGTLRWLAASRHAKAGVASVVLLIVAEFLWPKPESVHNSEPRDLVGTFENPAAARQRCLSP